LGEAYNIFKGKMTLLAGNSGVGKSTFINAIAPHLNLKTEDISDYHQTGRHTTTFSEVFKIDNETYIIDTPGIKAFGLIDMEKEEVGLYFPEIFRTSKGCKFYNCTHLHEPGCAVIDAVEKNRIGFSRYRSYISIISDDESKYR
jgi:ribosome biogenesis GTPase / thiamine phosphate phosphatase